MVAAAFLFPECEPRELLAPHGLTVVAHGPLIPEARRAQDTSPPRQSQVFSLARPRDAIAGAASGLKTAGRGVAAGAAALARSPVDGMRAGSVGGALRCLGDGIASAVLLPCGGVAIGLSQCARGVANTPEAMVQSLRGLEWCPERREWAAPGAYSLPQEAARAGSRCQGDDHRGAHRADGVDGEVLSGEGAASSHSSGGGAAAAGGVRRHGPNYYEVLRCQPVASLTELRRAYYRESRRWHPDKAGGDPRAVARFQLLSEAYKVLRDPALRRAYDAGGHEAVAQASTTVDLGVLYSAVLGGKQWEPYVGRLALERILATDFRPEADARGDQEVLASLGSLWCAGDSSVDPQQTEREVRCAVALAQRLQPAVLGEVHAFGRAMQEEAQRLAGVPFAPGLMRTVAAVYDVEAMRFLRSLPALDLRREALQIQSCGRLLAHQARAAAAGARALVALASLVRQGDACSRGADGQQGPTSLHLEHPDVEERLPALAAALWHLTVLDVEGTLRRVCRRVLRDSSTDLVSRVRRAEAMQIVATALRAAADKRSAEKGPQAGLPGDDASFLCSRVRDLAARFAARGGRSDDGLD